MGHLRINDHPPLTMSDDQLDDVRALLSNNFAEDGGMWLDVRTEQADSSIVSTAVWVSSAHSIAIAYDEPRESTLG